MYNKRIIWRKKLGVKNSGQIFLVKQNGGQILWKKNVGKNFLKEGWGGGGKKLSGKSGKKNRGQKFCGKKMG